MNAEATAETCEFLPHDEAVRTDWPTRTAFDPLEASRRRLEAADVYIAVGDNGEACLVNGPEGQAWGQALVSGFVLYSPADAFAFLSLNQRERRLFHSFKCRFPGGITEWKIAETCAA